MLKIDLHTHSSASPDGGITPEQYVQIIEDGVLDFIAITDHNNIAGAQKIAQMLGEKIIVGEEITTTQGEIIGLFLNNAVKAGLTPLEAAKAIQAQGGLVYIPHPFESVRDGVTRATLESLADFVDIIEVQNGRALFQNRGPEAATWARLHQIPMAASSDAHGRKGVGSTYSQIYGQPNAKNLVELLHQTRLVTNRPPLRTLLYPKLHRLRKKVSRR